jgi:hypothetical protein
MYLRSSQHVVRLRNEAGKSPVELKLIPSEGEITGIFHANLRSGFCWKLIIRASGSAIYGITCPTHREKIQVQKSAH